MHVVLAALAVSHRHGQGIDDEAETGHGAFAVDFQPAILAHAIRGGLEAVLAELEVTAIGVAMRSGGVARPSHLLDLVSILEALSTVHLLQ